MIKLIDFFSELINILITFTKFHWNKMFFSKDDIEVRNLVTFFAIYTSVYFPILIAILFWTNGIYFAGKCQFNFVILLILIAELLKYFSSAIYFKSHDVNLSKKYDEKTAYSNIKSVFSRTRIKEGFKNLVIVVIMIFIYFAVAILYGAEVFNKYEETFMFSSMMSILTIFPACMNLGSQSVLSLVLGSKPINNLEALLYQNFYMSIFGAWLGAFVIPLDWDRPWQVWPIPCSFGAMIGFALSHFVMMFKVKIGFKKRTRRNI